MAITTTPANVRAVSGTTLDDAGIQPFIDAAVCILTGVDACMTAQGVTDAYKDQACTWLAAHLIAVTGAGVDTNAKKSERFEAYSVQYAISSYSGRGVLGTKYGEAANGLSGGCLQSADKAPGMVAFFG